MEQPHSGKGHAFLGLPFHLLFWVPWDSSYLQGIHGIILTDA